MIQHTHGPAIRPSKCSRPARPSAAWGIAHQRCPRCHRGLVFRGRFAMNNLCPACALKFEREPGYFVGAMYISYAIAAVAICMLAWIVEATIPPVAMHWDLLIAGALMVPLVPAIFRYSRVIWMFIDRAVDPE